MSKPGSIQAVAVLATILFGTAACVLPARPDSPPASATRGTGAAVGAASGVDVAAARARLSTLTVAKQRSMAGYSRDRFPHWRGVGGGCDTRDAVLRRDGTGVVVSAECHITAGSWRSPYDGKTWTDPQRVDIDHVVPLANAWRSGADAWTDARRADFANDLTRPQLLAVTAAVNRAKGDQDPSQWKPPDRTFWCGYADRWITVKAYYHLTVTGAERAALSDMLATCG